MNVSVPLGPMGCLPRNQASPCPCVEVAGLQILISRPIHSARSAGVALKVESLTI